jgi:teichuronic acid exporter
MSLKKQALSGVKWTGIQQIGTQLIGFAVSIILARLLSPDEFGLLAMITIIIGIGNTLLNAGMGLSLIRSENIDDVDYNTVFYFNLGMSHILYIIIYLMAPLVAHFYHQPILIDLIRGLSIVLIFNAFYLIQQTRLTKMMDFKTQAKVMIPALLLSGFIGIGMAYAGFGVWSLIVFNVSKSFFSAILFWLLSDWRPSKVFDYQKFKKHFKFGYKLSLSGLIDTVFRNIYNIVIGKFFPVNDLGYYQRANSLQQYPVNIISTVMRKVTYSLFAQIQHDNARLKRIYRKILQMNIFVLAPVLLTAAVLAKPLFIFLFTEKWVPAVPYFQILILSGILYPIHAFNLNILNVKGRSDLFLKLEIIKKSLVVIAIFIGIQFGIFGLLYAAITVSFISFFINSHYSGKFIDYPAWEQLKDISMILLTAAIAVLPVYLLNHQLNLQNNFIRLLLGSLLSIFFYLSLSYIFKLNSLTELMQIIKRK